MSHGALRFTAEHEWVRAEGSGAEQVLRIGITGYAQQALGDIVFVTLPELGAQVIAGQALGEVESTKSVSDLYAPVTGTVTGRNEALDAHPELINSDPLGDGWIVEITPADGVDAALEGGDLLDEQAYASLTSE